MFNDYSFFPQTVPSHNAGISFGYQAPRAKLCGYLDKLSPDFFHSWQRRYFVLIVEEQILAYYKESDFLGGFQRQGIIPIRDILAIQTLSPVQFQIVTPMRIYDLMALTSYDKDVWVNCLRLTKDILFSCLLRHLNLRDTTLSIEDGLKKLYFQGTVSVSKPCCNCRGTNISHVQGCEFSKTHLNNPEDLILREKVIIVENARQPLPEPTSNNAIVYNERITQETKAYPANHPTLVTQNITHSVNPANHISNNQLSDNHTTAFNNRAQEVNRVGEIIEESKITKNLNLPQVSNNTFNDHGYYAANFDGLDKVNKERESVERACFGDISPIGQQLKPQPFDINDNNLFPQEILFKPDSNRQESTVPKGFTRTGVQTKKVVQDRDQYISEPISEHGNYFSFN